jgi:hypothetical protein
METNATRIVSSIYLAATAVLKVRGLGGRRWKRNVAKGARIGPWLQAEYVVIDSTAWMRKGVCLYLVSGVIREFGMLEFLETDLNIDGELRLLTML